MGHEFTNRIERGSIDNLVRDNDHLEDEEVENWFVEDERVAFQDLLDIEGFQNDIDEKVFMDCEELETAKSSDSSKRRRIEEEEVSSKLM